MTIDFDDFMKVDIRVGRITRVEDFPEARKPAWKLFLDFGEEIGEKRSSAQITNYSREELEGSLVVAVVNFPPRQIGPIRSEVLVLGVPDEEGHVILLRPTRRRAARRAHVLSAAGRRSPERENRACQGRRERTGRAARPRPRTQAGDGLQRLRRPAPGR